MCHGHHDSAGHAGPGDEHSRHEHSRHEHSRHDRGRRGPRGRRGFPSRTQLVERLQGYQQQLEGELANTRDLLDRLTDGPEQSTTV